jgi:hypothetical protein
VAHSTQVLDAGRSPSPVRLPRRVVVLVAVILAIAIGGIAYLAAGSSAPGANSPATDTVHAPAAPTTVVRGLAAVVARMVASRLFASASVVVVAPGDGSKTVLNAAAGDAERTFAPMLLTSPGSHAGGLISGSVAREIAALHPADVLAVGVPGQALASQLAGVTVVTKLSALPAIARPASLRHVALLVPAGRRTAATIASIATARSAGLQVIQARDDDPRADSRSVEALARAKPQQVLAVGAGFGTATELAAKVTVAETGVQLPGGGQVLFPGHRLVCLYGSPGTPALGALGEQGLRASIARVRRLASLYRSLSHVPVVPAFEILATVAQGSAGRNGLYSYESSVASLRPWVRAANRAGLYVILDLQPGRANFLDQAKLYQPLLRLPDVGLALDPEWKLQPGQLPLQQIGHVGVAEVNSVITWLAALTAKYHLPQKLVVIHQFELSMLQGESRLDTHHSDLAIVIHMDGQGAPSTKQQTWDAVVANAPRGVFFGWKNFFVKDHPMEDPQETMQHQPQPVMISYQ